MTRAVETSRPVAMADDLIRLPVADVWTAQALSQQLRQNPVWLDVVPGLAEIVCRFDPGQTRLATALETARTAMADPAVQPGDRVVADGEVTVLPVRYGGRDGPDLDKVCQAVGLSRDALIARHAATVFTVELMGFTPGFAYCGGLDPALSVARLRRPRTWVPAGAVGLGMTHTGLYALAGPGGWPLIGRTPVALFDPDAPAPFRLEPGQRLRFEPA